MTDIIKHGDTPLANVRKGTKLVGRTPFEQRIVDAQKQTLSPEQMKNRIVLTVDCSSSMIGDPINILKDAASAFVEESLLDGETSIAIQSFPAGISAPLQTTELVIKLTILGLKASGGTPMYSCLKNLPELCSITRVVLISDGEPTDWREDQDLDSLRKSEVLRFFIENKVSIDTIHASKQSQGEEILRNIAEVTGGIFIKFQDIKNLTKGLRYLSPRRRLRLTSGQAQIEGATEVKI
jgi:uncharacterized protein YegL